MRRLGLFLCCLATLALAGQGLSADLPSAWRAWRYSRDVQIPAEANSRSLAEIRLPWEVLSRAQRGAADLRLIDDQGREVPYEWNEPRSIDDARSISGNIVENSFVAGKYTQVVADFGDEKTVFGRIRVATPESDFLVRVEVAVSDDLREWRVVEFEAPIGRVASRNIEGTQDILLQALAARYVRLRILQADKKFPVTQVLGRLTQNHPAETTAIPANVHAVASTTTSDSGWQADMTGPNLPVREIVFATNQPEFYRIVRASTSADGKVWMERCSGIIYRYEHGGKLREDLALPCSNGDDAFMRIEIFNGNDAPLSNLGLALRGVRPSLVFYEEPGRSYRLLYGNERATSPVYDIAQTLGSDLSSTSRPALALGQELYTSNFQDPRPFTERHPSLLWIALGIAVIALGLTAIKTMKSASGTDA